MAGGESFGSGGGSVGNAGMCPVCGFNQTNLTQHMTRHSKEEIIRSVMYGHPLPELANRRPPGRCRRPSYSTVGNVSPISSRPTSSQNPLLITGSPVPGNDQTLGPPLGGPISETPPTPVHTVRLGPIGPLMQPSRNNVPLAAAAPLQHNSTGNSFLLIGGNNVFPPGSVLQNNLPIGSNGVSYLIPSSGGLMLAAAPSANQTILLQTPTSAAAATPQPIPMKLPPPPPVSVTGPTSGMEGVYSSSVPRRQPRAIVPEPICLIEEAYSQQGQEDSVTTDPYRMETNTNPNINNERNFRREEQSQCHNNNGDENATIHIGKNISISLPKDLVGKKDRLKEIIVQELVRALLINDSQDEDDEAGNQPSTSTGRRKSSDAASHIPAKPEPIIVENTADEYSSKGIRNQEQFDEKKLDPEVDPLAPLNIPSSSKCRNGSDYQELSNVNIEPNVPSPAHNITIENGLDDNFNHPSGVSPYNIQVDEPMEVVFEDRGINGRLSSGATNLSSTGHPDLTHREERNSYERTNTQVSIKISNHSAEHEMRLRKSGRRSDQSNTNMSVDMCNSSRMSSDVTPIPHSSVNVNQNQQMNRNEQEAVLCCDDDQLFLSSDRSLNTLLGDSTLHEMVYVEEQVLGAVEEVFAGDNSSGTLSGSNSNEMNTTNSQKNVEKKPNTTFLSVYEEQCMAANLAENRREKMQDVKCKSEPPTSAPSQPGSSGNRTMSYPQNAVPATQGANIVQPSSHVSGKIEDTMQEREEELVDDPTIVDEFTNGGIFPDDQMFERELSNQQTEEVMSLKASETLADSDSERATPHEELQDLMFYDRSCMFAGEPGPANLSPRNYPSIDSSAFHSLTPALISHLDHAVQMDGGHPTMTGLVGGPPDGVMELSSSETTMHLSPEDCCTVLPSEGMMTQLFPATHHEGAVSTGSVPHIGSMASASPQVSFADFVEEPKFHSKQVLVIDTTCNTVNRQLSPVPSTSGLQTIIPQKALKEDEDYEFEYESDCYGDSDSDSGVTNRGPLDLDHWKCCVCNKMFKSLKEKLLHAGQHSPCAEAMEKSGAIRRINQIKSDQAVVTSTTGTAEKDANSNLLQCKQESGLAQDEPRSMLESCASNGEYKCPECSQTYTTADELLCHRKMVFKSRVTCQICHVSFKKRVDKIKHMKTHTVKDLRCLLCNRSYPNRYAWSQHQFFHMGLVLFECKECARRFQRRSELKVHLRTHTGERPYQCVSCSSAFTTRQALKRHLVTHMDGQEVDCDVCQKTYKNIVCLNKHKLKSHPKGKAKSKIRRDYMCKTCNEVFPSEKKLAWHQEIHERWPKKCQQCGECFIHQSSLTKHIRQKHNPHHQTSDGKTENNATCHVCLKVFRKSSLALHLRTHTGVKPFKCHICNRSFAVKCNLDAHRWVHMGVRDRPHKCKMCERSFHRKKDLEAHVRSHKNIRPFTCNECGKSFIHKNNLQLHVREHSGDKQHKCLFCGKAFFRKYNLNNHVRIHTGETPYECTICHKDFTQKSNYNVHMKAFHVERHAVHEEL